MGPIVHGRVRRRPRASSGEVPTSASTEFSSRRPASHSRIPPGGYVTPFDPNKPAAAEGYRRAESFPALTAPQIARIAPIATRRPMRAGEILFDQGDENVQVFV